MAPTTPANAPDPRRIAAVLANDDMRILYASIVLGQPSTLSAATTKKALAALIASGLVHYGQVDVDGAGGRATVGDAGTSGAPRVVASAQVFRDLLAQHPPKIIATGVHRFLRDGRIDRYPSAAHERIELLRWVVGQALTTDEVLTERDVNERLARFADDVAALRRYLVDAELLERTASGSSYARVADADPGSGGTA
jgi:hypothetical protein